MVVCHFMAVVKDQTASLAFTGVGVAEHVTVGMATTVKFVVDAKGDPICRMILYMWREWCIIWKPIRLLTLNS